MRDYSSEYKNYHSKPEQKKNRAGRNLARRLMKKKLGSSINGKDIDHKDKNPRNNAKKNIAVVHRKTNRGTLRKNRRSYAT